MKILDEIIKNLLENNRIIKNNNLVFVTNISHVNQQISGKKCLFIPNGGEIILPIAFGIAISRIDKKIIIIQDSNNFYKSLSSVICLKDLFLKNIIHIVINDSSKMINLKKLALQLNYEYTYTINKIDSVDPVMKWVQNKIGSSFIEINDSFVKNIIDDNITEKIDYYNVINNFKKNL